MSEKSSNEDWTKKEIHLLVTEATRLVSISDEDEGMSGSDSAKLAEIGARACRLIEDLYGRNNTRSIQIRDLFEMNGFSNAFRGQNEHVRRLLGILNAVAHDIANDRVAEVRDLIRAEVFSSFLEMAEYLLNKNYKDAAAVLAGGVLENVLRSLASRENVSVVNTNGRPLTMGPLNDALCKAEVYNSLTKKQINSFADVRNAAAHGDYNKYVKDDVTDMIRFVTRFAKK